MNVEVLSLSTALCYSLSAVLARKGMRGSNPLTGAFVTTFTQVIILSALQSISPPKSFDWMAVIYFTASGILASFFGRICNYMSIERIGVPISASIIGSTPLFSTFFAVLLIGEKVAMTTMLGAFLVVLGVVLTSGGDNNNRSIGLRSFGIILPVLSASFYGVSSAVRKMGLIILPDATIGAFIGASSSLISFAVYLVSTGKVGEITLRKSSIKYFGISGVIVSIGWLSMFNAFKAGEVSTVATLIGTYPLFSVMLSWLMLRSSDKLGWRVLAGCSVIVSGATIVTLF